MPEHRRRFSPQFEAEVVQMVIETGKPIAAVARDLGIHDGTLANWVNACRREHPEPDQPLSPVERARVKELENEFLKKAAATGEGWLYLATVIDLATKMVTGWQLADHMRTSLITGVLQMAVTHGHVAPAPFSTATGAPNTPRPGSPGSAASTASGPAAGRPGCAGTTRPPRASSAR